MAISKKPSKSKPKPKSDTHSPPPPAHLHPPYFQMIGEAISSLKERTGSSQPAIAKFMEDKYRTLLPPNFKKILSVQLKRFVRSEKLVKLKNSYKISTPQKKIAAPPKKNSLGAKNTADKDGEKRAAKMKRLSQVKTPESMNKRVVKARARARARV
ncbi:histone H1-like [Diospyros lotus]|uniref:histone H1-like n=1 Tax=Diospyros lotus TaxID=55363 RepID=UPI0022554F30|nr:histone H1-like [Diospyros lotus]